LTAQPPADAASRVDSDLVQRAYRKVMDRQELTKPERAALKRHEREKEERLRWQYYSSIPQKHWRQMSGRQAKVINEQAERYGIPWGGPTVNLPAVVRALHDFLADNAQKLARDDDPLMQGSGSPALERYRKERPEREHLTGWEGAESQAAARSAGAFSCPACGEIWNNDDRVDANLRAKLVQGDQTIDASGAVQGEPPPGDTLGFRWSAVNNLFVSPGELAADEWRASRASDEENAEREMRQFVWSVPVAPTQWEDTALVPHELTARMIELPRGIVPSPVQWLGRMPRPGRAGCHQPRHCLALYLVARFASPWPLAHRVFGSTARNASAYTKKGCDVHRRSSHLRDSLSNCLPLRLCR
jgi:hypothetical protein